MGSCPKCNATIDGLVAKCPSCGAVLPVNDDKPGSDTLNVNEHFGLESEVGPAAAEDGDNQATLIHSQDGEAVDLDIAASNIQQPAGSDTLDVDMGLTPEPDQLETSVQRLTSKSDDFGTAATSMLSEADLPDSSPDVEATIDSDMAVAEGDKVGTVVNPLDQQGSSKSTAVYSETDLREALEGRTSGTSGKLKRLWDVAAGSSDNPLHTLRGEEALASDSLFRRVAMRKLAPANAPSDEEADYVIVDKVGQGGMGIVYSARQTNVNRLVALKQIKGELLANDDNRRKFFYEAQITADLDHPNIVPIYELGSTEDGRLFYAMKLITGTEWKDSIKTNSREENLEILFKVNDAMAFAHSKGIVHRDLKPANTMIGPYGEVYVTDWGMAIDTRKKMRFGPGGSPAYMAPEMALHQVEKIGRGSDIYILGAILFQIITGTPPHPGRSVQETLRAAARNNIVSHDSEDALMPIALRAMATNVEDRYQTVEEFQEALRQYRQHAESIALARRSEELLVKAIEGSDYDLFSRSVFGYRDAVELWPENLGALTGQRRAQLEYGKCAVAKGDYDLAMQVLDQQDNEQRALYQQAVKGKQANVDREKRVKNLRRIVAAVVFAGIIVSSSMAAYAWMQRGQAIAKSLEADKERSIAVSERDKAKSAQEEEKKAKELEKDAREKAEREEANAREKEKYAVMQKGIAEEKQREAERAQAAAEKAEASEKVERMMAEEARKAESLAKVAAIKAAAKIKLEEYKSALPLAKSQIESYDVKGASTTLNKSAVFDSQDGDNTTSVFMVDKVVKQPKSDTWPWRRVKLLSNIDLPKEQLAGGATALDYAPAARLAVVGTKTGEVNLLSLASGTPVKVATHTENGAVIEAVAISPQGDEVVFSFKQGKENGFRAWPVSAAGAVSPPVPVGVKANYLLQGFAYSQDGSYIFAGIDKGIWMWQRKTKWYEGEHDTRFGKMRGRLKAIVRLDENQALVATQVNGLPDEPLTLYSFNLADKDSSREVVPPSILEKKISAINFDPVTRLVVLGTEDGKLYTASLQATAATSPSGSRLTSTAVQGDGKKPKPMLVDARLIMPVKHRTGVENIVLTGSGEMLTTSAEPVMHVWRRDDNKQWEYDTYLTGTAANLAKAMFIDAGKVIGIDDGGLSMVWDVQRQKQRRQLERTMPNGTTPEAENAHPIVGAFTTADGQTIAVDSEGTIERWETLTGKMVYFDGQRQLIAGHTPGARFVDMAVDAQAGIVATVARLDNVPKLYRSGDEGKWEFCIWKQADGSLLRRWRSEKDEKKSTASAAASQARGTAFNEEAESEIEPRLSLVDNGRALILASDYRTQLISLQGEVLFNVEDFGTYFAVPNPKAPNELMLVMRSGSMAILDLTKRDQWASAPREYALNVTRDAPLQGTWSPDGRYFYLVFTSGAVARAGWDGKELKLLWTSHMLEGRKETIALENGLSQSVRVKSHTDMDLAVKQTEQGDRLCIARRIRGVNSYTSLMKLDFGAAEVPKLEVDEPTASLTWLDDRGAEPELKERLHARLRVDNKQVLARQRFGDQVYITTNSASVFRLQDSSETVESYGRERLLSVTASKDAKQIIALFADGSLKKFELADWKSLWKPCGYSGLGCSAARLSPDGTQLALVGQENGNSYVRVVDAVTGVETFKAVGAVAVTWDPQTQATGALCYADGRLETFLGHNRQPIATKAVVADAQVIGIEYFLESWSDPNLSAVKHLVVHTETAADGQVQFVPLEGQSEAERKFEDFEKIGKNVRLSVSPTEGVLVTGDEAGTVKVWFASPSWDSKPKELYELEGHRGAKIELATFSADGTTLISTDSKNRVFGWLSSEGEMK